MSYCVHLLEEDRESSVYRPLDSVRLRGEAPTGGRVILTDGEGRLYAAAAAEGEFEGEILIGGALGTHRASLVGAEGEPISHVHFRVDAKTGIESDAGGHESDAGGCESDAGGFGEMWLHLESMVRRTRTMRVLHGEPLVYYVPWIRDDVHVMKAFKYWEPEMGSVQAHFLDLQRPDGMVFDYIRPAGFAAERMEAFGERYYHLDEGEAVRYDRLPVEADVEYLTVEGVYTAWQASGDDTWMARQLPRLEKAIEYAMSDPLRWSEEHELVKRAYTIDTWDFKFFGFDREHLKTGYDVQEAVFNITPETPKCIMHGDNSGMYQACRQVARMHRALGHEERADEYDRKADGFREKTDEHCWNGRYYDHWVPVDPLEMDQGGVDGSKVLSLSNPYDINRGLAGHEKAVKIIEEYRRLREELADTHFAEWVSVYPCWPKGFSGIEPNEYVNGGIIIIVAGELAKAAFHHGFEEYGADILDRVNALMREQFEEQKKESERGRRLRFACTYTPEGEVSHGIPDNWAQAAVMSAMMEGLCGLRDESTRFEHARIEPRWVAAGVRRAAATARYGASGGYVGYRFDHQPEQSIIRIDAAGSGLRFDFHVLLPPGARAKGVARDGQQVSFAATTVEDSPYADFQAEDCLCTRIEIEYERGD